MFWRFKEIIIKFIYHLWKSKNMTFKNLKDMEEKELIPGYKVKFIHSKGLVLHNLVE